MKYTYEELAGMIDHSLLHPTMTDNELEEGCRLAARYGVVSVCIKPYFVKQAAELLKGTAVKVGAVIGFPHGPDCVCNETPLLRFAGTRRKQVPDAATKVGAAEQHVRREREQDNPGQHARKCEH